MIIAIGTDAIEVDRVRRAVDHPQWGERFRQRVFTAGEIAYCLKRARYAESFAARFAAKEAVMKALGAGIGAFALTDVEVCRTSGTGATRHAPYLVLRGGAAEVAGARGAHTFHLSLTHTEGVAIAFVVAEQARPAHPETSSPCAPS